MTLDDLDLLPAPGRHVFPITDRVRIVVLEPIDGLVVGYFVDQVLVHMVEEAAGGGLSYLRGLSGVNGSGI